MKKSIGGLTGVSESVLKTRHQTRILSASFTHGHAIRIAEEGVNLSGNRPLTDTKRCSGCIGDENFDMS